MKGLTCKMSLTMSAVGLVACLVLIFVCSMLDKKSGEDRSRLIISIAGIMAMMCLFFLIANLLLEFGILRK